MMHSMHGLFLTCTQNLVYIYTVHNQLSIKKPLCEKKEKKRTPKLLGSPMFCSWWRIPIQSGFLSGSNCPPFFLTLHPFPTPTTPLHYLQRWHQQSWYSSFWTGTTRLSNAKGYTPNWGGVFTPFFHLVPGPIWIRTKGGMCCNWLTFI